MARMRIGMPSMSLIVTGSAATLCVLFGTTAARALQLPSDGAFQVKVQELKVGNDVLVKNALPTKASVAVPRSEIICIKVPSDWEKTVIWTGSYRVNCFNGTFDESGPVTKLKTQCGTLAKNTVYEVEQKQDGQSFTQTETEKKGEVTTVTRVVVRPFGKC